MTTRVWDIQAPNQTIQVNSEYSEFVFGLDWSLFDPGLKATCAWDESVLLFK